MEIASHPKVGIKVHTTGDVLCRITLFLSNAFTLDCASTSVREKLLPWLKDYSRSNWKLFPIPLPNTPFSHKVATHLQTVPFGKLITYQDLAAACKSPKAARAVGNFCQGNLFPLLIPCHRVVPKSGGLGSFTPDPRIKEQLLHFEGVTDLI